MAHDFFTRYKVTSVVDLECGVGSFLDAGFDLQMSRIEGYELNLAKAEPYIPSHLRPFVSARHVTLPIVNEPFDCSWSVEVGEHLEPAGTAQFLDNLVNLSSRLILQTGQRGTCHINLRPKEEWISLIRDRGPKYLPVEVEMAVTQFARLGAPGHILRNLIIFQK